MTMHRELSDIIALLVEAGEFDLAIQAAQQIEDAWVRIEAFREIAIAMAKAGQTERVNQAFQLALQAIQQIEDAWVRLEAFREISVAMARAGQLYCAFQATWEIEDEWDRLEVLKEVVEVLLETGQFDLANQAFKLAVQVA